MRYFILISLVAILGMACNSASTSEPAKAAPAQTAPKTAMTKKATAPASTSAVNWVKIDDATKMAKNDSKLMIVDVYTAWCGPCKMMDRSTFSDKEVAKIMNEKFIPVKFNAESPDEVKIAGQSFNNPGYRADIPKNRRNSAHQLVSKLGVRGYPTLVVMDADMNIKANLVGFKQPAQLLAELAKL